MLEARQPGSSKSVGAAAAHVVAGASAGIIGSLEGTETAARATAGESEETTGFLEVCESEFSKKAGATGALVTAGVSEGITGLLEVTESDSPFLPNSLHSLYSCLGSSTSACARLSRAACAVVSARVCPVTSSSAEFATVAHAHASILRGARNSGGTGGLLPVQRFTSYCLDNSWSDTGRVKGPTGRRSSKGWLSGPAKDLRPVVAPFCVDAWMADVACPIVCQPVWPACW